MVHYATKEEEIPKILSKWSSSTKNFLIRWFYSLKDEEINEESFISEFREYTEGTIAIHNQLEVLVNSVPFPDFYADTF